MSRAQGHLVGRKAATAGELLAAGFPVPPGVCLTVAPFLAAEAATSDGGPSEHSAGHDGLDLPADLVSALWEYTSALPFGAWGLAVRSSAVDEDGSAASLAGAYTSVLGVRSKEDLARAIEAVWQSYFAPGAGALRGAQALSARGMGVLIQPVIEAECGGVAYSLDPVRPESGCVVINAAWGLPVGVADGLVQADTIKVNRDPLVVVESRVAEKRHQVVLGSHESPVIQETSEGQRRAAVLPAEWAVRIAQFALAAEAHYGRPQDVEWAVARGHLWLLQSRSIASLPSETVERGFPVFWEDEEQPRRLWWRSQPSGREQSALLPLEADAIREAESTRAETCRWLGADKNRNSRFFNGRHYAAKAPPPFAPGDGRVRRQAWRDLEERLAEQGLTGWDYWGPEIVRATERLAAFEFSTADGRELAMHLEDARAVLQRHTGLHPQASKQPPGEALLAAVERATGLEGAPARETALQLAGSDDSILTQLFDALYELACLGRANSALVNLLLNPQPVTQDELDAIPNSEPFKVALHRLLSVYGDRNGAGWGSEATIATCTWRERPVEVLRAAAVFLAPDLPSPRETRTQAARVRAALLDALCASTDAETAAQLRHHQQRACRLAAHLEEHNHYIDQLSLGQLRRAALAAGTWLVSQRVLRSSDEVLWLSFDEIIALLRGGEAQATTALIAQRRADHARHQQLVAPPFLGLPAADLPPRQPVTEGFATVENSNSSHRVCGEGASPHRREGRARVAADLNSLPRLAPGDILVAPNVGPLWVLFLPVLAGIVLDEGAVGQHAAAIAREYGIAAVVNTRDATRYIPDGATIVVDGSAGTVEVVE